MDKIRAKFTRDGKTYDVKVVTTIPEDAERVSPDLYTQLEDLMYYSTFDFYHSSTEGYICIKARESIEDICDDITARIKQAQKEGGNPATMARMIRDIYAEYKSRMADYDECNINLFWDDIKDRCDLM